MDENNAIRRFLRAPLTAPVVWIVNLATSALYFRRMNACSALVDDVTDRTTDLSYALFLLSLVPVDELGCLADALTSEETQARLVIGNGESEREDGPGRPAHGEFPLGTTVGKRPSLAFRGSAINQRRRP